MYGCSPDSEAGYINESTAANVCKHLRRRGCRSLHIGGGEPLLNINGLITLIRTIIASGINIDYIETNAAWITDDDGRNRQILRDIVNAGGDCIMVSADPFHVEFIPFWKPQRLIQLLREMGISHFVWQDRYLPMLSKLDSRKTYNAEELQAVLGYDVIEKCAHEYGMGFNGRALNLLRKYGEKQAIDELLTTKPCANLRNASHFHVDFLGRYIPPGCTGMGILIEEIDKELDGAKYPVMSRLFDGGIKNLLEYAQSLGFQLEPNGYVSKCDLCFEIRKFLVTCVGGSVLDVPNTQTHSDLTPTSFYRQDF